MKCAILSSISIIILMLLFCYHNYRYSFYHHSVLTSSSVIAVITHLTVRDIDHTNNDIGTVIVYLHETTECPSF